MQLIIHICSREIDQRTFQQKINLVILKNLQDKIILMLFVCQKQKSSPKSYKLHESIYNKEHARRLSLSHLSGYVGFTIVQNECQRDVGAENNTRSVVNNSIPHSSVTQCVFIHSPVGAQRYMMRSGAVSTDAISRVNNLESTKARDKVITRV